MQDRELYQQILGLETPWEVSGVELAAGAGEIRIAAWRSEARSCRS